jgi:DNA mismatch repair protein MutS2
MKNVVEILSEVTPSSLVLLDELGTSTDPEEGSALAKGILAHLAEMKVDTIATTHHRNVAAFAEATPGMMNASVQHDSSTLRPTYHITMGIPGRSYAMSVAASLGLPPAIMENAESLLEPQYMRFEDWLTELQKERDQLQTMLQETERQKADAESLRQKLQEQIDYLIEHRDDILNSIRRDAIAQYEDVRRQLRRAEAAISWTPSHPSIRPPSIDIAQIRRELEAERQHIPTPAPVIRRAEPRPLEVGDAVQIRGLNLKGTIASLPEQGHEAEVNVGRVNLKVDLNRILRLDEEVPPEEQPNVHVDLGPILQTTELDIRGLRTEESLIKLEEFLDKAVRDGLSSIRVIHGRGTGALRNAVREHLRRHPMVRSFDPETRERGGNGATLVQLA